MTTEGPVNNIYRVPVELISFMACSEGRSIQGTQDWHYLSEGDSSGEARIALRQSLSFAQNYNDLPIEKRQGRHPFRFRDGPIEKVLKCDRRFKNRRGDYTCGKPLADSDGGNGEFGMCVIEGYSVPDEDCPYTPTHAASFNV